MRQGHQPVLKKLAEVEGGILRGSEVDELAGLQPVLAMLEPGVEELFSRAAFDVGQVRLAGVAVVLGGVLAPVGPGRVGALLEGGVGLVGIQPAVLVRGIRADTAGYGVPPWDCRLMLKRCRWLQSVTAVHQSSLL